jgi:glycosyltransferase involved in cell wall biosynthesis
VLVSRPLRVGLNLFHVAPGAGGTLTYARELLRALLEVEPQTRVVAFVTEQLPDSFREEPWAGEVRWARVPGRVTAGRPWNAGLSLWSQWALEPLGARRRGLDVLHGEANAVAPLSAVPTVATILDLVWMHHRGTMRRRDRFGMEVVTRVSARRADRLIALSEAGRDDLVQTLGVARERIDVTPLGVRMGGSAPPMPEGELRRSLHLGRGRIVLCVAQKRVHKNLDALVRALALLQARDAVLVLPGAHTPYEDELRRLATKLGVADRVHFPGWVDAEQLQGLYAAASCFVLASKMEGFGLPVVEAMEHGVPVACSNLSALPEVAGGAALLFDPRDDAAIAAAVDRLLADPALAAQLAARGRERCAQLTWERTAQATFASYRRAIAQHAAR